MQESGQCIVYDFVNSVDEWVLDAIGGVRVHSDGKRDPQAAARISHRAR